ncbi:aldehyde dehydrogenase family protein [Saccharothrix sp. 6-C]|uniref:aldehyde dehydrogenase family protein n=1 Tax=Saccharothrix sp. 6-C TaxID=2781735 RepID=UPI001916D5D1|nr:aldehyde dehydrogenase family protein [Saccharothrix sp. 6-C]QQQ77582.1 aldehyde dehydrogenase family protein [Saccharothrix sp. 6-C]
MARYAAPGAQGSVVSYRDRYDHFIGGEYAPPAGGGYFADRSPVTGEVFTEVARGAAEDLDRALDAAHGASRRWGRTSPAERATVLNEIADRVEDHLDALAVAEAWESGTPVGKALAVDLPSAVDHFRYFAGVVRAQAGGITNLGGNLVAHHFPEPIGVVGQVVPWRRPLLAAAGALAPALAAGNAVVLKPAEQTPASIHVLVGLIADLLPPGVVNVVNGLTSGPSEPDRHPHVFFADVAARRDAFYDRALRGFTTFALGQALVQSPAHDRVLADVTERVAAVRPGHPLDTATTIGALSSHEHVAEFLAHVRAAEREGARIVLGGERADLGGELSGGYYVLPTVIEGRTCPDRDVRGPVVSLARFDDVDDAVKAANEGTRGVGAGVWSRDAGVADRVARRVNARRVWLNSCRPDPGDRAAIGHYQQTKTLLAEQPW